MAELGLSSSDVFGAVVAINFAELTWRAALSADFKELESVTGFGQLADFGWLVSP